MEIAFGEWLQVEIDKRGWSWNKLATTAKLSSGTIYNIRDGSRGVGEDSLKAIAGALKLPIETVYRAAGFLPSSSLENIEKEELAFLFDQLPPEEQAEIIELLRFKAGRKKTTENKTSRVNKTPARIVNRHIEQK
jgi:transcriptional regulator with XRE-family HTH domain